MNITSKLKKIAKELLEPSYIDPRLVKDKNGKMKGESELNTSDDKK